jgi:putative phosphoesterase
MKIGILSDTHNNVRNLQAALRIFLEHGIKTVIHCGDLTSMETAHALAGFHVICTYGNGDIASGSIRQILLEQNPENFAGMVYTGRINGARIAVTHGHMVSLVEELLYSGAYDYVFKGHSHLHCDERYGHTRLINPGALGGRNREPRQVCILDLETGQAVFQEVVSAAEG